MSRPANATTQNRTTLPEGRRKLWGAMRFARHFTLEDLTTTTECSYPNARRYVRRLLGAGYLRLQHEARGAGDQNQYFLCRDTGPHPPIPRFKTRDVFDPNTDEVFPEQFGETARDRAWKLIRDGHPFELRDLIEEGVQRANAFKYLAGLIEGGIITQIRYAKPGPGGWMAEYQLVKDLGPKTPVVQRNGSVYDPNTEDDDA
ncbi:hypothetical protein [Vacuolonema iberomarrocanum]|uniref:hypothetical protein n=1 Tax=Vacuolonema iberomarrocanum TaxID=3454632 RepID=UPI0019E48F56|nr:hypothetical protein [filamentous cyanobacterium LEGE 07170]